jgi:glutathione synthase/RimK-type ligase-like ATP-grasp enzyme
MGGIIGAAGDPHVVAVADHLRARGIEPVVLDLARFPRSGGLSLLDGVPTVAGVEIQTVTAWYLRSAPLPLPFQPLDEEPEAAGDTTVEEVVNRARRSYAAGRERRSFLFSFLGALEHAGAVFINRPGLLSQHFLKLDQLGRLRRASVPVPRTLATNDPEAVLEFSRGSSERIVYKPVAGGGFCRRVTEEDLAPERLRLLANAPVLFQEEIPGRNLRVYVVEYRVVASYEIASEDLDYRGSETAVFPTPLSDEEGEAACRAALACELPFTGIDIRRRPDGGFAVLECNPSPMFSGIERMTGDRLVSRALANLLVASDHPVWPAQGRRRQAKRSSPDGIRFGSRV